MAENIDTKKLLDLEGLQTFTGLMKDYVDRKVGTGGTGGSTLTDRVDALETTVGDAGSGLVKKVDDLKDTVGDNASGLVQKVNLIQGELDGLNGGAGSITTQIENAISALDLPNTYEAKGAAKTAEDNAKAYADGLDTAMDTRVGVLEGYDVYVKSDVDSAIVDAKNAGTNAIAGLNAYKDEMTTTLNNKANKSDVEALQETIGNADSGLVKDVADLKDYADGLDTAMDTRVNVLETTVGNADSGLVKGVTVNRDDIDKLIALFEWE